MVIDPSVNEILKQMKLAVRMTLQETLHDEGFPPMFFHAASFLYPTYPCEQRPPRFKAVPVEDFWTPSFEQAYILLVQYYEALGWRLEFQPPQIVISRTIADEDFVSWEYFREYLKNTLSVET